MFLNEAKIRRLQFAGISQAPLSCSGCGQFVLLRHLPIHIQACSLNCQFDRLAETFRDHIGLGCFTEPFQLYRVSLLQPAAQNDGSFR